MSTTQDVKTDLPAVKPKVVRAKKIPRKIEKSEATYPNRKEALRACVKAIGQGHVWRRVEAHIASTNADGSCVVHFMISSTQ